MRDGQELVADVYLPDAPPPFPVILIRTPYNRKAARSQRKAGLYCSHGFAVVIQEVRGTGESPQHDSFYPWLREGDDGHDTLLWLAAQSFCNGNVGTLGGSYLATAQWLAAPGAPPCLKCMVPYVGPHSFLDGYYHGGAHYLLITLSYGLFMAGAVDFSQGYEQGWKQMHRRYWQLPLSDADLHEGRHNPFFQDMILKPFGDEHWRMTDGLRDPGAVRVPVLELCGWFDAYTAPAFRALNLLRSAGGSADTRTHSRILVGGWGHDRSGSRFGAVEFGPNVCFDLYAYEITWFKHWLMGIPAPLIAEPPVRVFTMGANTWQDFRAWPPEHAERTPYFLHSGGAAGSSSGDGTLSAAAPREEPHDRYRYDPLDPVVTIGGNHSADFAVYPAGPLSQQSVEERTDVLVYTSEPLRRAVETAGPVELQLFAASSAPDTDFTAKLVDVQPDGTPLNITEGIIRARYRESLTEPRPLEPHKVCEYTIGLIDTSHVFLEGHRIRLEVSSSNFPRFSRNLNTGADNHASAQTAIACQLVFHDDAHPSALWVYRLP